MEIAIFVFIFGLIVGSFLNVCIVRMPHELSVVTPRSHCTKCKKTIPWYDNIPLVSYLLLGGKCRFCKEKFSFLYFFVELLTGCIFLGFYLYFGLSMVLIPYLFMVSCFIVATIVDFKHRIIPDEISVGGMYFGLVFSLLIPSLHENYFSSLIYGRYVMWVLVFLFYVGIFLSGLGGASQEEDLLEEESGYNNWVMIFVLSCLAVDAIIHFVLLRFFQVPLEKFVPYLNSLDASIIGLLAGGAAVAVLGMIGDILFKKESMGGGDVKLVAMMGAFMGWQLVILTFFIAPFFGSIFGIIEKIRTKDNAIAYGPFLVLGALICLFYGDPLIAWIKSGYGLY